MIRDGLYRQSDLRSLQAREDRKVQLLPKVSHSERSSSVKENLKFMCISWMWFLYDQYKITQQATVTQERQAFRIPKCKITSWQILA